MIAAWLANKAVMIAVVLLAILGTIMTPVAVVQTIRLDGFTLLGWHITDGALKAAADAKLDLNTCRANTDSLQAGISKQNASIAAMGRELKATQARAAAALAAAKAGRPAAAANQAAIIAAKPGPDICKSADALILEMAK